MAYNYLGNSIPAPSATEGERVQGNFEILYSTIGYTQKGVTLKPGQGVIEAGAFLAQDPDTKRYVKYDSGAEPAQEIKGMIRQSTDTGTDANGPVWQANILYGATVKLDMALKANGLTDGAELVSAFGGRADDAAGYYKF